MLPWFIKKARAFVCGVGFLDVTRWDKKCKIEQKWADKNLLVLLYVELCAGDGISLRVFDYFEPFSYFEPLSYLSVQPNFTMYRKVTSRESNSELAKIIHYFEPFTLNAYNSINILIWAKMADSIRIYVQFCVGIVSQILCISLFSPKIFLSKWNLTFSGSK